jgi:Tol biopolymer transport system component
MTTRWAREGGGLPNVWVANPGRIRPAAPVREEGQWWPRGHVLAHRCRPDVLQAFQEKPFSDDIYRGSLANGEVARVIGGRSTDLAPTVSTDGTKIAFPPPDTQEQAKPRSALVAGRHPVRLPGGERSPRLDIASITPDGSDVRVILSTKAWETNPVPSPDGTRIVFTSDRDRRGRERLNPGFELYTIAVDGSDIVRVTNNRQLDFFPDWQRLP